MLFYFLGYAIIQLPDYIVWIWRYVKRRVALNYKQGSSNGREQNNLNGQLDPNDVNMISSALNSKAKRTNSSRIDNLDCNKDSRIDEEKSIASISVRLRNLENKLDSLINNMNYN